MEARRKKLWIIDLIPVFGTHHGMVVLIGMRCRVNSLCGKDFLLYLTGLVLEPVKGMAPLTGNAGNPAGYISCDDIPVRIANPAKENITYL